MKKYIITIIIALGMIINVSAQGDGFFAYSSNDSRDAGTANTGTGWTELPNMPSFYGNGNQPAPLGSGFLLLAGMGIAYGIRKRKKE